MQTLRVALAQLNTTIGDFEGNRTKILDFARQADALGADVVAFPELAVTGYPPEDQLLRPAFIQEAEEHLLALAREATGLPPLVVGCLDFTDHLYNTAAVIHGGAVLARYHKQRLPNYGVFDEERYFQPGDETLICTIGGVEVGITICEDAWYPEPVRDAAVAGAEVVININGSPFHAGKTRFRERMIATRAADNTVALAYVNQVGGQDELVFDGNSIVADALGNVVARGRSMDEDLVVFDVIVEEVTRLQLHDSRLRRMRELGLPKTRRVHVSGTDEAKQDRMPLPPRDLEPTPDIAEVYQALVVGTRDYVRKTGFEHAFIALSGGIDSAFVAAVAVDALGSENVTGVSMPSRYSSEGSIADAVDLAERLGVRLISMPIEDMHSAALSILEREFEDDEDVGLAGENVQSRARGMLMMALSNHRPRSMVLTTGNKSEYACGYATLYGDMVGGYAVIKDVPKLLVWDLARYRNTLGAVIPQNSIDKPPSAELRPDQLDTDSLPPYEVLDPIVVGYVEEDLSVEAIVARGFDEALVRRVIDMINRNEYKRRQSPPGVKITPRAFGRDRRLPLATKYRGY